MRNEGGRYVMRNGKRVLVERTEYESETAPKKSNDIKPATVPDISGQKPKDDKEVTHASE